MKLLAINISSVYLLAIAINIICAYTIVTKRQRNNMHLATVYINVNSDHFYEHQCCF